MSKSNFWNDVYRSKRINNVSWYADRLNTSLEIIKTNCSKKESSIIDIGAGRSNLVDDLHDIGYKNLTLLDISKEALKETIIGDISKITIEENLYDLWHDRAVFHFLTEESQRKVYLQNLKRSLKKNGIAIIATFGPDGPDKCSGLTTIKYDKTKLMAELGEDFQILGSKIEYHQTPFDTSQQFLYCWFKIK